MRLLLLLLLIAPALAQDPEDEVWRQQYPIGPMQVAPGPLVLPGGVVDKQARKIFPKPTVFLQGTLYVWFSSFTVQAADYPGGPVTEKRSGTAWQFFPNGRFFYDGVTYSQGTSSPTKVQAWGRYHIGPDESLKFETDGGEQGVMQLAYGRRNLVWNETTYGEVNWENEALKRMQNQ